MTLNWRGKGDALSTIHAGARIRAAMLRA
jgi:hypothetical protein